MKSKLNDGSVTSTWTTLTVMRVWQPSAGPQCGWLLCRSWAQSFSDVFSPTQEISFCTVNSWQSHRMQVSLRSAECVKENLSFSYRQTKINVWLNITVIFWQTRKFPRCLCYIRTAENLYYYIYLAQIQLGSLDWRLTCGTNLYQIQLEVHPDSVICQLIKCFG